jgi:hypothetical protein
MSLMKLPSTDTGSNAPANLDHKSRLSLRADALPLPFSLNNCERDFKQESRRNKKLRFAKFRG